MEQKGSTQDGYAGCRRCQREEVDEEVPGVPGPDAVVHPNTVMVETVHTPVTHPCREGTGSAGLVIGERIKTDLDLSLTAGDRAAVIAELLELQGSQGRTPAMQHAWSAGPGRADAL